MGDGNIDVRSWVGKGRPGECSARLASYLSKYITKSLEEAADSPHRYRRSHNIAIEEAVEEYDDADLNRVAAAVFARQARREPGFILRVESGCEAFLWACSWGRIPGDPDMDRGGGRVHPSSA